MPPPGMVLPGDGLLEFGPSSESFVSSPPALGHRLFSPEREGRSRERDPPLLSFLLPGHIYQGCPVFHGLASRLVRGGEGCQALAGAVLRVGSLSTVLAASVEVRARESPSCSTSAPRLRGLLPCRSRPWSSVPSELSPLEEPYPLSRASCFPAGSRSTAACAIRVSPSPCFRRRADPLPRFIRGCTGRMGQDDGFPPG